MSITAKQVFALPLDPRSRDIIDAITDRTLLEEALALEQAAKVPREARVNQLRLRLDLLAVLPGVALVPSEEIAIPVIRRKGGARKGLPAFLGEPEPEPVQAVRVASTPKPAPLPPESGARSSAYMAGRAAFGRGVLIVDVPPQYTEREAEDWTRGWEEVAELASACPEIVSQVQPTTTPEDDGGDSEGVVESGEYVPFETYDRVTRELTERADGAEAALQEARGEVQALKALKDSPVFATIPAIDPKDPVASFAGSVVQALLAGDARVLAMLLDIEGRRGFKSLDLAAALVQAVGARTAAKKSRTPAKD